VIDPQQLLEQVLGTGMATDVRAAGQQMKERLDRTSGTQVFAGGALAGGLLGMLLGGKQGRKLAGGVLGYGGAAAIGALALRAYQNYQQQQAASRGLEQTQAQRVPADLPHAKPAADGSAFELVLVRAMVGAAKADGHIDAREQQRLFAAVERLGLDAESKAYVFDLLTKDIDLASLAAAVATPEQGAELYLAATLAVDPDEPAERAYLDALAGRLRLPAELRAQLDRTPQELPT
jgi:uncharacterized membrane protein YebE (DUF533 family)